MGRSYQVMVNTNSVNIIQQVALAGLLLTGTPADILMVRIRGCEEYV